MQYVSMRVKCGFCMTNFHDNCNPVIASPAGNLSWVCTCDCPTAQEAAKLLEDDATTSEDSTEIELDESSSGKPMHKPRTKASTGPSV